MISEINKAWNWKGFIATQIIRYNDFGNIIFKTDKNEYWRICPEELSCEKVALSQIELDELLGDSVFKEDWEMGKPVKTALDKLGKLDNDEKYCLIIPASVGGTYESKNMEKIRFSELISVSGDLAKQINDMKDGQAIEIKIID
nr:T6SS immunity protein Tdi1 domain-containing protein [uncultured Draconibacterium sp.]